MCFPYLTYESFRMLHTTIFSEKAKSMNESELTVKAIAGSRDAFCDLYDLYRVRLYRYAYYKLSDRDDAEDAVSSCILSAWAEIGKLKDPEAFPAWIFRILRGACAGIIRTQIAGKKADSLDDLEGPSEVRSTAADPETSAILMDALSTLDEESREMVLLSAVGGLTGKDISEMYGMPQGTVRSRLSRSFAAMRKMMEAGNER